MQGTCIGPLGERPSVLAHIQTCPSKDAFAGRRGVGFDLSGSSLYWGCCVAAEVLLCWWVGVENGITLASRASGGELAPTGVQETLTENRTSSPPLSQASVRLLPSACLCLGCWHIQHHNAPMFYVWHVSGIQNSKS